jgi:hypothetical protein
LEKTIYLKLKLIDEIENKEPKKLEIKTIRIEVEIPKTKRTKL